MLIGYLFLDGSGRRLKFISDGPVSGDEFEWDLLIRLNALSEFVERFRAVPTTQGPLKGWRIEAHAGELRSWFVKLKVRDGIVDIVAGQKEASE